MQNLARLGAHGIQRRGVESLCPPSRTRRPQNGVHKVIPHHAGPGRGRVVDEVARTPGAGAVEDMQIFVRHERAAPHGVEERLERAVDLGGLGTREEGI